MNQETVLLKATGKGQVRGGMGKLLETMERLHFLKANECSSGLQRCAFGEGNVIPFYAPLPTRREKCAPCQRINRNDPEAFWQWQHSLLDELLQKEMEAVIVLAARVAFQFQRPFKTTIDKERNAMILCTARGRKRSLILNAIDPQCWYHRSTLPSFLSIMLLSKGYWTCFTKNHQHLSSFVDDQQRAVNVLDTSLPVVERLDSGKSSSVQWLALHVDMMPAPVIASTRIAFMKDIEVKKPAPVDVPSIQADMGVQPVLPLHDRDAIAKVTSVAVVFWVCNLSI